ncbi:MAG: hypothetical protein ACLU4N_07070 [Butyricimonas faecihominis]
MQFYVLGTALAFVFVAIVLRSFIVGNEPPMVNADRIVLLEVLGMYGVRLCIFLPKK